MFLFTLGKQIENKSESRRFAQVLSIANELQNKSRPQNCPLDTLFWHDWKNPLKSTNLEKFARHSLQNFANWDQDKNCLNDDDLMPKFAESGLSGQARRSWFDQSFWRTVFWMKLNWILSEWISLTLHTIKIQKLLVTGPALISGLALMKWSWENLVKCWLKWRFVDSFWRVRNATQFRTCRSFSNLL